MPIIKTARGREINTEYQQPALPPVHKISETIKLLGKNAELQTGQHWSEALLQRFFDQIVDKILEARAAMNQASNMRLDPNMRPDVAAVQLAERRREVLLPVLSTISNLSGSEVARVFESIEAFSALVLEMSESQPVQGMELVARKMDVSAVMPKLGEASTDGQKLSGLVGRLLNVGRFDLLNEVEKITPVLVESYPDFAKIRREWAFGKYPELKNLLAVRELIAERVHGICSRVHGCAALALHQGVIEGIEVAGLLSGTSAKLKELTVLPRHPAFEKYSAMAGKMTQVAAELHASGLRRALK